MYLPVTALVLFLATSSNALVNARGGSPRCTSDACGAAVSCKNSNRYIQSAHREDCSSYQRRTVTPSPTTRTTTVTKCPTPLTVTTTVSPTVTVTQVSTTTLPQSTSTFVFQSDAVATAKVKRDAVTTTRPASSPSVPTYATSACSNRDAYASACACWGIPACTVTATRSTAVSTVTVLSPAQKTVTSTASTSTVTENQVSTVTSPVAVVTETVACSPSGPGPVQAQASNDPSIRFDVYCRQEETISGGSAIGASSNSGFQNCVDFCSSLNCASLEYLLNGNAAGIRCVAYRFSNTNGYRNDDALFAVRV